MNSLWQDLRYGARMLRKNPGFTLIAVITLGLGIGANTAIFSVVYGVLLRPLPFPDSGSLVWLSESSRNFPTVSIAFHNFVDWKRQQKVFDHLGIYQRMSVNLTGDGDPQRLQGALTSSGIFASLGVQPIAGRLLNEEDDQQGAAGVAVISHGLWQRRFGGQNVINKAINLNGQTATVVGVMPPGFAFPSRIDLWASLGPVLGNPGLHIQDRGYHSGWFGVARLKQGVTLAQATGGMDIVAQAARNQSRPAGGAQVRVVSDKL